MESMRGILHKTSVQEAHERQAAAFRPPSVAGQKRDWSTSLDAADRKDSPFGSGSGSGFAPASASQGPVRFQTALYLPQTAPRLSASRIVTANASEDSSEYTQRRIFAATPSSSIDPELNLAHPVYKLPPQLVHNFASLGIKQIYPWQKSCLKGPGLLTGDKNLVYCAPTGGGKSLVADLLMLKRIIEEPEAKALLILPYVALVQEKVRWLRTVVQGLAPNIDPGVLEKQRANSIWRLRPDHGSLRVVGFFGGGKIRSTWQDFDIGICTLEKLRAVVLDELHMIDDDHRGYLLELIATKLLSLEQRIQIIGMSATLPNANLVAQWLNAHSYETRYRPIPIEEHLVCEGNVYHIGTNGATAQKQITIEEISQGQVVPTRQIGASDHKEFRDPVLNAVVSLAYETAMMGYGSLIFAGSRSICESDARLISRVMPQPHELDSATMDKRMDLLSELRSLSTGADPVLEETVLSGVAFHRTSLAFEERDLIAEAPARRVILHNARMGREYVGPSMLRQMRGRAGRQGKSPVGETYLCCRQDDLEQVLDLMYADIPEIASCLNTENKRVQRAILEVISVRLANSHDSLLDYFSKSLISYTHDREFVETCLRSGLEEIHDLGLIVNDSHSSFTATQLGRAIVASSVDPYDGVFIHAELTKTLKAFVMDGEMHILYVFTPVQDFGIVVNWQVFRNEMDALDESGLRVLRFLGIKPTDVLKFARGVPLKESTPEEKELARVYRRFYLALQLRDLCNEMPIHMVARKYDSPRGSVQTLAQTCQGFAAGMIKFCEQMGWGVMAAALEHFSDRLMAGARTDLLALAKIPFIKSRTARVFWENGYRTVGAIANADPKELVLVLMQAQPNKLRIMGKADERYEEKLLAKANVISASANRLWQVQLQAEIAEE
ncbi:DEAD/DEAH box helicase [Trichoderma parareesei]|uniref:DEAD/DEAH box helicase n=1 Tax=Trichoderma parareesei TaxID=858221 RepID=A0A2H2ZRD0_TRIPA|nr:DEAD/DEAH box helicase [Trichoderma parareesei]